MDIYKITVFDPKGELLFEDSFEAKEDDEAKQIGEKKLEEQGYIEHTHRVVSPRGKLVLFHS
ncbi:YhzD family protein [Jeotgalibacillus aurantiacus]|uniref:YhzD family protein n=1 Tax=Jeotgalibacillus aurantiacus TaxID=2763266 RepID=UPI001D0AD196|nr:YhzD family protein [Jeotgalibacillus aurantiacus]